jgi:hypothetical protein
MLRAIAYGTELNMAHPPRPTGPAIAWEPDWNVKIRVKSMTTTMIGMGDMGGMEGAEDMSSAPEAAPQEGTDAPAEQPKKKKKFNPLDAVKDVIGQ